MYVYSVHFCEFNDALHIAGKRNGLKKLQYYSTFVVVHF